MNVTMQPQYWCLLLMCMITASGCESEHRTSVEDGQSHESRVATDATCMAPLFLSSGFGAIPAKVVRLNSTLAIESTATSMTMEPHHVAEFSNASGRVYTLRLKPLEYVEVQEYLAEGTEWLLVTRSATPIGNAGEIPPPVVAMPFMAPSYENENGGCRNEIVQALQERLGSLPPNEPVSERSHSIPKNGNGRAPMPTPPAMITGNSFRPYLACVVNGSSQSNRIEAGNVSGSQQDIELRVSGETGVRDFRITSSSDEEERGYRDLGREWLIVLPTANAALPEGAVAAGVPKQLVNRVVGSNGD